MGMSIDEHIGVIEDLKSTMSVCMPEPEKTEICTSLGEAIETMRKYQMLQADYENRLKADMVAMLTELCLEIEEKKFLESSCYFMDKTEEKNYAVYTDDISNIIQQKIDALKGEQEAADGKD